MTDLEAQMREDSAWAMSHYDELDRQYRGQYVVVWKQQVVAHGLDTGALFVQAVAAGFPREELVLVAVPDPFLEVSAW